MKNIHLLGKKIIWDKCPLLVDYKPDENWRELWLPKTGDWEVEDGCFIGTETGNMGGIMLYKEYFKKNVMLTFTVSTVLPATRDLNAVFCAHWDESIDYLGNAYVVGFNGWYEHKSGIERSPETGLRSLTGAYSYTPGKEIRVTTGIIEGHSFLYADDVLVAELIDPHYISGGHVGFSPTAPSSR